MGALTLILGIWGAALSTGLAALHVLDRRRLRRRLVQVDTFVVRRHLPDGALEYRLHVEATNLGEQPISLKQWVMEDADGGMLAGSPYEGRPGGPDLLQPRQIHGWTLEPDVLAAVRPPVRICVVLTSGERFPTRPVGW